MRLLFLLMLLAFPTGYAVTPEADVPAPANDVLADASLSLPPENARSIEEFDTTSDVQRRESADASEGGVLLGQDVVALGDPVQPRFWVQTALVDAETSGRAELLGAGGGAEVALVPTDGSGRISLAALRVLDVSFTDLVEEGVYDTR